MDYTQKLEDAIFEIGEDEDISAEVLQFLNDKDSFRDFGKGLRAIINRYIPNDSEEDPKDFLKRLAKEKGINLNRNTVNNWFSGKRPKKGEQSRLHMYKVSFAIGMTLEDTCELFQKVYLDRPFNMRDIQEFVYYYCIKNSQGYDIAKQIIDRIVIDDSLQEESVYTRVLQKDAAAISTDESLIQYILSHPHNFQISNKSAKEVLARLLQEIRATSEEKELLSEKPIYINDGNYSYIIREIYNANFKEDIVGKYKSLTSIETMLDIITIGITRESEQTGQRLFKSTELPQEIVNRFPQKQTFSKEEPSFEELRKMIVLLYSYKIWFEKKYNHLEYDMEDYMENMNNLLFDCGLQELYYGNPFDWLFLYCSMNEDSLDVFREIMAETREYSE